MQKNTHAGGVESSYKAIKTVRPILIAGAVFVLDQLFKWWLTAKHVSFKTPWRWLSIGVSTNEGIAFSLPFPRTLLVVLSVLIVAVAIGWWVKQRGKTARDAVALGLFIGGALGNLADRMTRGAVVDYLNIWTGSFNAADAAIVLGLLLLVFRRMPKSDRITT